MPPIEEIHGLNLPPVEEVYDLNYLFTEEPPDIPTQVVKVNSLYRYDLKKLLAKWKQQSLNARIKPDPAFAASPIYVTNKDYEFSIDPEIITLVESDPFYGYESETVVAHLTKLM